MEQLMLAVVEANTAEFELLRIYLNDIVSAQFKVHRFKSIGELETSTPKPYNAVLTSVTGIAADDEALDRITNQWQNIPFIAIVEVNAMGIGLKAIENGATDFLVKDQFDSFILDKSIQYSIRRKQLDRDILLNQRRLEAAMEIAEVFYWELDNTNQSVYVSAMMVEHFPIDEQRLSLEQFLQVIPESDQPIFMPSIESALSQGKKFNIVVRLKLREGKPRAFIVKGDVVREDKTVKIMGTLQNVSSLSNLIGMV